MLTKELLELRSKGHQATLVKLGLADNQHATVKVDVLEGQAADLPNAQPQAVENGEDHVIGIATIERTAPIGEGPSGCQQPSCCGLIENEWFCSSRIWGFCPKIEGGRFVEDGRIAPGGSLAVNTNGGGLSCVHPGIHGLFTLVEAGVAGERQVAGAELALCHGNGGLLSSQATVILGSDSTW